jgi:prepilin-type N-terminal cleavage/methylation domain-containing protein
MSRRGVTLLETLVALALTALVLGALSRSLAGAARSRSAATAEADRLSAARTILLRLAAEVESAVGERGIAVEPEDDVAPSAGSRLRLTTAVPAEAGSAPASDRRAIAYEVDGAAAVLLRREWAAPRPVDAPEQEPLAVLAGVRRLTVHCSDGSEWRRRWDASVLPRAVELVLAIDDGAGGVEDLRTTATVSLGGR